MKVVHFKMEGILTSISCSFVSYLPCYIHVHMTTGAIFVCYCMHYVIYIRSLLGIDRSWYSADCP